MKPLLTLLALTTLLLFGCKSTKDKMNSWVGAPESALINSWGGPDSSMRLDDGSKVLTWIRPWTNNRGQSIQGRQSFTVSGGVVKNWSFQNMP